MTYNELYGMKKIALNRKVLRGVARAHRAAKGAGLAIKGAGKAVKDYALAGNENLKDYAKNALPYDFKEFYARPIKALLHPKSTVENVRNMLDSIGPKLTSRAVLPSVLGAGAYGAAGTGAGVGVYALIKKLLAEKLAEGAAEEQIKDKYRGIK